MTTLQIMLLTFALLGASEIVKRVILASQVKRQTFLSDVSDLANYINESRRGNSFAALRASEMLTTMRKGIKSTWKELEITQLEILWRSKFGELFRE